MSDAENPETEQANPETPAAEQAAPQPPAPEQDAAATPDSEAPAEPQAELDVVVTGEADGEVEADVVAVEETPREKPAVPGAHLEVDIVPEGADPLDSGQESDPYADPYAADTEVVEVSETPADEDLPVAEPIAAVAIDLGAGATYRATGKRKTAVARVTLRPGTGTYVVNGRTLEAFFPRDTLQRNVRQPLEAVGFEERMDVVARLHGGGIAAQAGALRHGISRALLEADPNLRGELKRRGFLTRDSRAKERKKAGLKKARKRPQFSKR